MLSATNNKTDHKQLFGGGNSNMHNRNSRESTALSGSVKASQNAMTKSTARGGIQRVIPQDSLQNEKLSPFTIRELGSLHSTSSVALNER